MKASDIGTRYRIGAVLSAALLAVGMASCTSGGDTKSPANGEASGTAGAGGASKVGDVLTVADQQGPLADMNPAGTDHAGVYQREYWAISYEPLIHMGDGGKLEPRLATDWGFTDKNNTKFKLTLRKDAKFSDGTPVTAEAVKQSLEYWQKNSTNKYWIVGASIEAPTDDTVLINLQSDKPRPLLPTAMSDMFSTLGYIVSPKGLENPDALKLSTAGAGAYMLDSGSTIPQKEYVYVQNPNYYDKSRQHWKKIVIRNIPEASARLAAVRSGQAQVAVGATRQIKAAKDAGLQVVSGPLGAYVIVFGDMQGKTVPALAKKEVRQALQQAIDWKGIAHGVFADNAMLNQQLVVDGMEGYDPALEQRYAYDPEKAKQLLADAGYSNGFDAGELLVAPPEGMSEIAQAIASDWAKIGVNIKVLDLNPSTWTTKLRNENWPVFTFMQALEPMGVQVSQFFPQGEPRTANSDYSELYELVQEAREVPAGSEAQNTAWQKVSQYISANLVALTGVMPDFSWIATKEIGGLAYHSQGGETMLDWFQK